MERAEAESIYEQGCEAVVALLLALSAVSPSRKSASPSLSGA